MSGRASGQARGQRPRVVPLTPDGLAGRIAGLALDPALTGASDQRPDGTAGVAGASARGVRVGVDGPVVADTRALAEAVRDAVAGAGRATVAVHAEDFLRARSLRLEYGVDTEAYLQRWYDHAALRREVLDPLGPGGSLRCLSRLRDPVSDRPYREPAATVPAGSVAVVDGRFLGVRELADAFDVVVLLEVSPAACARRLPEPERGPVTAAWQEYLGLDDPVARATLVVRFDHPDRPAVVEHPWPVGPA
jgi:hypothetical protein